ncbi:MAG: hypothetical protein HS113_04185 [Verrucomicrobiales bacterium]|nr:hypothetical protein [Verrucomicrobiales bacterium]
MTRPPPPPVRPLIPKLLLAGLLILVLSWLAFMTHYVRKVANQPRGEAPPRPAPAASTNPLSDQPAPR